MERPDPGPDEPIGARINPRFWKIVILVAASCIVVASLALSQWSTSSNAEHFSQLWLVPVAASGGSTSAELGVRNYEGHPVEYEVTLFAQGSGSAIESWSPRLGDGKTWRVTLARPAHVGIRVTLTVTGQPGRPTQWVALAAPS